MLAARWTTPAYRDLEEIEEHIRAEDPGAAAKVAQAIWDATTLLVEYPQAGRPGRRPGTRELVVDSVPYLVAYRVWAGAVEVLRVLHSSRKWPEKL